jgi:hypothetical protein
METFWCPDCRCGPVAMWSCRRIWNPKRDLLRSWFLNVQLRIVITQGAFIHQELFIMVKLLR